MKKNQIKIILAGLIFFFLGCLADRAVLILTAPKEEPVDLQDQIRISDGNVQWHDGVRWIQIETVENLSEADPFVLSLEDRERLEEELSEGHQEALDSLSREMNEPTVKKKEVKRPISRPSSTPSQEVTGGSESAPSGGSSTPSEPSTPTPPPVETPPADSGDGENMEWSNDYL